MFGEILRQLSGRNLFRQTFQVKLVFALVVSLGQVSAWATPCSESLEAASYVILDLRGQGENPRVADVLQEWLARSRKEGSEALALELVVEKEIEAQAKPLKKGAYQGISVDDSAYSNTDEKRQQAMRGFVVSALLKARTTQWDTPGIMAQTRPFLLQHPDSIRCFLRDFTTRAHLEMNVGWIGLNILGAVNFIPWLIFRGVQTVYRYVYQNQIKLAVVAEMEAVLKGSSTLKKDQVLAFRIKGPFGTEALVALLLAPEIEEEKVPTASEKAGTWLGSLARTAGLLPKKPALQAGPLRPTLVGFHIKGSTTSGAIYAVSPPTPVE